MVEIITLTPGEVARAWDVGLKRYNSSIYESHGRRADDKYNQRINCVGACGELAAAIALGVVWPAYVGTYHTKPDIEPCIEVRTLSRHHYDLIVRPGDRDGIHLLVTGDGSTPTYHVHGWIFSNVAMQTGTDRGWWYTRNDRPPCWWVPQSELSTMDQLRDWMRKNHDVAV